jgi:hypothetical protein
MAAQVSAALGLAGHDLGSLEERSVKPVELGEDDLGVARLEVEQGPGKVVK